MSDQSTIESLADKLAAADLTDDEVKLLVSLFADDDDVSGFASKPAGYTATDDLWEFSSSSSKGWIGVLSARAERR